MIEEKEFEAHLLNLNAKSWDRLFKLLPKIEEAKNFYTRYPKWSKMGKMIRDLRSCIDAVEDIDYLDKNHIYLLGNSIGGAVSLVTAALDNRVSGVASVAAFSPWCASNQQYESLKTYSHLHGLIPRIGFFIEQPQQVPVDFSEIIAAASPTPILIIAPDLDRYTDITALKQTMLPVTELYDLSGKKTQFVLRYPHEINRMTREMYPEISAFFKELLKKE